MKNILKIVLAVGAALAVVAGVLAWRWYNDNKRPNFRHEAVIYVYPGDDAGEVMKTIADSAGVALSKTRRCPNTSSPDDMSSSLHPQAFTWLVC